jgi:polyvinyl alcohol dehydrogenase (cytochrome)
MHNLFEAGERSANGASSRATASAPVLEPMRSLVLMLLGCLPLNTLSAQSRSGEDIFTSACAACHGTGSAIAAPHPEALRLMSAKSIESALVTGRMKAQGAELSPQERVVVAQYLGLPDSALTLPSSAYCSASLPPKQKDPGSAEWSGWGASANNQRFQSAARAGLRVDDVPRLKLKWAFGLPGVATANAQPTLHAGRLYVASAVGTVYSLDAKTGCIHWTFQADDAVRNAVVIAGAEGNLAFFGDLGGKAYAIDTRQGKLLWKVKVDDHPDANVVGSPVTAGAMVFFPITAGKELEAAIDAKASCCTFRGSLIALRIKDGSQAWKSYTINQQAVKTGVTSEGISTWGPSGAGIWSAPTIDERRGALYVGTGVNYSNPATSNSDAVIAFDMKTGHILWSQQMTRGDAFNFGCLISATANCPADHGPDHDIGAPPLLLRLKSGKSVLIVSDKGGMVRALDPDKKGKIIWSVRAASGGSMGGIQWGIAADDHGLVFLPVSDWDPLHPEKGGGLIALDAEAGKQVWAAPPIKPECLAVRGCSAAQPAPPTAIPGAVFSGSLDGHIRAYDTVGGQVIWDFNTLDRVETINGIPAHGGSLTSAGPAIAGGMLYVMSGYSRTALMPGNLLLAFSVGGK